MADPKFDGYSKDDLTKKLVDGETGGVTFNNLKPATDYDFVATYAGEDPTKSGTDLGKVTTAQVIPSAPAIKLTSGDSEATAVITPNANADNEAITQYNLYVKSRSDNWPTKPTLSTTPDKLTVTIPNLTNGTEYTVGVTAVNAAGESDYSATGANDHTTPNPPTIAVTGVDLQPDKASIDVGKTQQLTLTVTPDNATNKDATYTSSDDTIATVDKNGLVTGVKGGTATITVSSVDGNKQATSAITVNAPAK